MNRMVFKLLFGLNIIFTFFIQASSSNFNKDYPTNKIQLYNTRTDTIENFDDGIIELLSYPGQDSHPNAWILDSLNTYNDSRYSLKLYGNTWKMESINSISIQIGDVWQVSAFIRSLGEIQGFGLMDSINTLFYSFAGTEQLNIQDWVTVYQGAFPLDTWNIFQLPVAENWLEWFGYLPTITNIVFINDRDIDTNAVIYFDEVLNITNDLPISPQVQIWDSVGEIFLNTEGKRSVDVQFYSQVTDSDSKYHEYFWEFGDDSTSCDSNPHHTYLIEDDHEYSVLLKVVDSTNLWGRATCRVVVDSGISTFPVTMNFVGDIMLARRYDTPGGLIDTLGVEAIFDSTLPYLGNAADITVANLECPLTARGTQHPTKPIVFRGRPANVAGLVHAGIDIVSMANNHVIDYGLEGLCVTESVLSANHIKYSGAGANSYQAYLTLFQLKSGVNIALLANSDRTGQYNNYQPYLNAGFNKPGFAELTTYQIAQQIQSVESIADLIVIETHAGDEYNPVPSNRSINYDDEFYSPFLVAPSDSDIQLRHYMIDQGADLVVGHHPHVIQGYEVYNGKLIAHSLGDFVFDLDYPETYPSMILNTKIDQAGFHDYSITPIYIDNYIPIRAKGELGIYILDYLARRSKDLGTYLIVNQDSVVAKIVLDTLCISSTTISYDTTLQLHLENDYWVSKPLRLPRNGNLSSILSVSPVGNWQFRLGREMIWFGNCENEGATMWLLNNINEFYDTIPYRGKRSLCQIRPVTSLPLVTNFEGRIICYSDTSQYTLHGWIKTQNANNASFFAKCYQNRTSPSSIRTIGVDTVDGTTGWNFYYKDFTPANGTNYFDINLRSEGPQNMSGYTWFDDVGIIEWENWQSAQNPSMIQSPNDYYWIQIRSNTLAPSATLSFQETDYNPQIALSEQAGSIISFQSFQNFPNPSKSYLSIKYNLLKTTKVLLKIFNALGQEVRTLVNNTQTQGQKSVTWDKTDNQGKFVGSGVYFCRLQAAGYEQSRKLILLK